MSVRSVKFGCALSGCERMRLLCEYWRYCERASECECASVGVKVSVSVRIGMRVQTRMSVYEYIF